MTLVLTPATMAHAGILPEKQVTIRDENEMGRKFDKLIRLQMPMVGDTLITDYIEGLVQRIVAAKRPMPFHVKSAVIANSALNAFATPGGFIYVFTGLIQAVESESQLAGVIAHELGHVSQRHMASRIEKQGKVGMLTIAGVLAGAFLGIAGGSGSGKAAQAIILGSQGMGTAAMLQYSQEDENEADHVGMNSLVKAGFNPEGMPQTFELMLKNRWFTSSSSEMPAYLSTHPGLAERIDYLNGRIKRMPESFLDRKDDNTTLVKVQALVRSKMSPETTALAYYQNIAPSKYTALDYMALGNVQARLKNMDQAAVAFSKALAMEHQDPLIAREAGIFYFKADRKAEAFRYLQLAVIKNKHDALALFYLARMQAEADQYDRAASNMRKVLELVPEDPEVHHHLGMILGESGDAFSGNLHLAYAAIYSGDIAKGRYHAKQAKTEAKTDAQEQQLKDLESVINERTKKDN